MAVLVLEAGVGALARLYEEQVGPELKMNLNRTFLENYSVRSRETAAIDQMQKEVSTSYIGRNLSMASFFKPEEDLRARRRDAPRRAKLPRKMVRALQYRERDVLSVSVFPPSLSFLCFPSRSCAIPSFRATSIVLHVAARNTQHDTGSSVR